MWRVFFKRFGVIVVATEDFDGSVRIRFAKRTLFGRLQCKAIVRSINLNDNETCSGARYVARWKAL